MKKMNNKGFSLVELIIVIAIMAILAGALAPALIKYIAKSRRSSDASNCGTLQTTMQTATSNEDADAAFVDATKAGAAKWAPLTGVDKTNDYWKQVDADLSGGLAAFQGKCKTTKDADNKSFKPTDYYWMVDANGGIHVGVGTATNAVKECVPTLDKAMGGKS